jgi:hypothetical protein
MATVLSFFGIFQTKLSAQNYTEANEKKVIAFSKPEPTPSANQA